MKCNNCGAENPEGSRYCNSCGCDMERHIEAGRTGSYASFNKNSHEMTKDELPQRFRPLGAWAYFGYSLLFGIPLVGLIIMIVFACGGVSNVNLKNYARSFFCVIVFWAIVVLIFFLATGLTFGALAAFLRARV